MMGASLHRSESYSVKPVDFDNFTKLVKALGPNTHITRPGKVGMLNEYQG
ncbi:MAG: hypothetical protein JXA30_11150 [Deltaproteobacteria bacterium]|nr:hypothetical protein [Deltaproteobacteria bacterium]